MLDTILLQLAKDSILSKFGKNSSFDEKSLFKNHPYLLEKGASFVTLHYNKDLRGCIGSLVAHKTLFEDIRDNAISAAFKDPRFSPLREDELPFINLEVSVLSQPKLLEYTDFDDLCKKIRPHIDGLLLQHSIYRGTFLPQVWEQLPTPKQFLEHLSRKAGANPSIYDKHPQIYTYQVDAIEERFDEILPL